MRGINVKDELAASPGLRTNIRKESNNMAQINFLMGGDVFIPEKRGEEISDSDARRKFYFSMRVGDVLEPFYFVRNVPTLTLNQYRKL